MVWVGKNILRTKKTAEERHFWRRFKLECNEGLNKFYRYKVSDKECNEMTVFAKAYLSSLLHIVSSKGLHKAYIVIWLFLQSCMNMVANMCSQHSEEHKKWSHFYGEKMSSDKLQNKTNKNQWKRRWNTQTQYGKMSTGSSFVREDPIEPFRGHTWRNINQKISLKVAWWVRFFLRGTTESHRMHILL